MVLPEVAELEPLVEVRDRPDIDDPAGAPATSTVRAPRDASPRVLDRAAGDATDDWASFDVNSSMRALRFDAEAQIRRESRKLHIHWWHANRSQMELHVAGVSHGALRVVPTIGHPPGLAASSGSPPSVETTAMTPGRSKQAQSPSSLASSAAARQPAQGQVAEPPMGSAQTAMWSAEPPEASAAPPTGSAEPPELLVPQRLGRAVHAHARRGRLKGRWSRTWRLRGHPRSGEGRPELHPQVRLCFGARGWCDSPGALASGRSSEVPSLRTPGRRRPRSMS